MKNLKDYIKNYIDESVWDIEDNIEDDNKEFILQEIKKFIKDNYGRINMGRCKIILDEKKNKYIIDCDHPVFLNSGADQLTNDFFEWGTVKSSFDCSRSHITSLKGAPKHVSGDFTCSVCADLKTLEGAPKKVDRHFYCTYCSELESLEGAPEYVGGAFSCTNCPELTSLKGAPEKVGGNFNCTGCDKLKTLEGASKIVERDFKCLKCTNLISLKGAPKEVGGDFDCSGCPNLHSLDGIEEVKGKIVSDIK